MKHGLRTLQGSMVVKGNLLETPSGYGMKTLQGGRVVLGKVVAYVGHYGILLVVANKL